MVAEEIIPLSEIETSQEPFVRIRLKGETGPMPFKALCRELKGHAGASPVIVEYIEENSVTVIRLKEIRVKPEASLVERLTNLSGGGLEVIL